MSLWRLEKSFTFEASHRLYHHDGKCARLHGHSWKGIIVCEGRNLQTYLPKSGMLMDYGDMSAAIKPLIEGYLDHYHLNDSLEMVSPTSEEIARWIFNRLKDVLPLLTWVIIEETCTSRCSYSGL